MGPIVPGDRHSATTAACPACRICVIDGARLPWSPSRSCCTPVARPARRRHRRPIRSAEMLASAHLVPFVLAAAAALGLIVAWAQLAALWTHLRRPRAVPSRRPAISILKPLCGLDDRLAGNLLTFVDLPYPNYEVLLGVRSASDPAYALAWMAARRWPHRFRLVVQQGEPGLNPKVNQLSALARYAHHEILVISDSNTRVRADYLDDIAAHLEDPSVGLVTHLLA